MYGGLALENDLKENDQLKDVEGKIVVIRRGQDTLYKKATRLIEKGAIGIIIVNDVVSSSRKNYETHPITGYSDLKINGKWTVSLSKEDGDKLIETIKDKPLSKTIKFDKTLKGYEVYKNVGISGFSSWGTNINLELKPDIVAPGEDILSTGNNGSYLLMSGTSMAAPHVAGATLLLKPYANNLVSSNPSLKWNVAELSKILLMNTAKPLEDNFVREEKNQFLEHSPRQQESGLLDLESEFKSKVIITHNRQASASLKELDQKKTFILTLSNLDDKEHHFEIAGSNVLGSAISDKTRILEYGKEVTTKVIHSYEIEDSNLDTPSYLSVAPKQSVEVEVTLDTGNANDEFVEGFIYFKSLDSNQPNLSIPYMGFKGKWNQENIIDKPKWEKILNQI